MMCNWQGGTNSADTTLAVRQIIQSGVRSLGDLFELGAYLDDLTVAFSNPTLTKKVRKTASQAIEGYIAIRRNEELARMCGRSWALGDLRERVLRKLEGGSPAQIDQPEKGLWS